MASSSENKGFLTANLEADRRKIALEMSELKEEFDIGRRFKAAVRENPWTWSIAAMITGFLITLLPARKKEVYVWVDPLERKSMRRTVIQERKPNRGREREGLLDKVWAVIKPILSTYIARKIYERVVRHDEDRFDRGREARVQRNKH